MSAVLSKSPLAPQAVYFGKLPSRGDFVRSAVGAPLIHKLDAWMSQTLELMSEDVRWKLIYDAAGPVHFAVLGPVQKIGLVGHLVASQDTAGRRFPFMRAAALDLDDPTKTLPYFPLALMPMWRTLEQDVQVVAAAEEFSDGLLSSTPIPTALASSSLGEDYLDSSGIHTLAQLALWVSQPPSEVRAGDLAIAPLKVQAEFDVRQTMLALGMLLQPVRTQGPGGLSKGLILPLPQASERQTTAMAFWSALIAPFFLGTHAELIFLVCPQAQRSVLMVGFQGLSPVSLRSAFDPAFAQQQNIDVADAAWVEEWVDADYGLRKLSTVLKDPALSWSSATDVFLEVFLGA